MRTERRTLYHATFGAYVPSIMEHGLGAEQHKNWDFSKDGAVYLVTSPDIAVSFCEAAEETTDEIYDSGIVLFEVDATGLALEEDVTCRLEGEDHSFMVRSVIPAARLRLVPYE